MKTLTEYLTNGSLDTKAIYGYKKKYYEKFFGDYYQIEVEKDTIPFMIVYESTSSLSL